MRTSWIAVTALVLIAGGAYGARQYPAETSALLARAGLSQERINTLVSSLGGAASPAAAQNGQPGNARQAARPAGRPFPVEVAQAKPAPARNDLNSVGSLTSDESVTVAAEVAGRIAEIAFKEGERVKENDVLVKLDDALARADLANSQAKNDLAVANFGRADSLSTSGIGTQRSRDEALANLESARAQLELSRVQLDKRQIRAPFTGVVGLRSVSVGAYAQAGQPLVNLEKIDTLKLDFRLPEIYLQEVKVGQPLTIRVDAIPDREFPGTVYAIDPMVDVNGRAIRVRARLSNPELMLRPGLFARVSLKGADRGQVVTVPEGAIVPRAGETFVFKVVDGKAIETKVRLGTRTAGEVEIVQGLAPNEVVVVAGQNRLRNGSAVEVVASTPAS